MKTEINLNDELKNLVSLFAEIETGGGEADLIEKKIHAIAQAGHYQLASDLEKIKNALFDLDEKVLLESEMGITESQRESARQNLGLN